MAGKKAQSSNSSKEEASSSVEFIGQTVQVTLDDARIVFGKVECFDSDKNMILGDTVQRAKREGEEALFLGYVMLPGSHIVKVEM